MIIRKARLVSLRMPVTVQAAAASEPPESPPTFEAVAYSGGLIPGYTTSPRFDLDYVIDLAGATAARRPVVNLDHDPRQRVGHETGFENTGSELLVKGSLSAATQYRDEVANSARGGYTWEVSQEASLSKIRKLAAGKIETINGREFTGPIYIVGKSVHDALAFVSQGADDGNAVNVAASAAGDNKMATDFDKWLAENDFDPEAITDKQRAKMQAAYDHEKNGGGGKNQQTTIPSSLEVLAQLERQENTRVEAITRMTHEAIKAHRGNEKAMDAIEAMGKKAIDENTPANDYEVTLLRATRLPNGAVNGRAGGEETNTDVIECALARAVSLPNWDKIYKPADCEAVQKDPSLRNFSLQQMLMRAAAANGYQHAAGERISMANLKRILRYAMPDDDRPGGAYMRGGGQMSTLDLPTIMSNLANKEILAGFMEEDNSWREISRIANAVDFKLNTAYRLTDSLEYEELPKGGVIKHGSLGEESYTRQVKTYARMLGLDRQDIINDDLSAFEDLRARLGRGAARKFNNVFWTVFLNNATFFTTARLNYITGSTTNLGTDGVGLGLGVAAFKKLKSADDKRIGGSPTILLVPPELEQVADQLYTGGNPAAMTVASTNVYQNKYRPVVVPWLSDTNFTGYSLTAWYLFRPPTILAATVVSFLNGNTTPTVESTEADFEQLGILFRGFHDFGVSLAEYLAGIKSKGAT